MLVVAMMLISTPPTKSAATVTITSPSAGQTVQSGAITISGTAGANQTVVLSHGGKPVKMVVADGSGHWSADLTNISAGNITVTAKAIENHQYAYFSGASGSNSLNRIRLSDKAINPGGGAWPVTTTYAWLVHAGSNNDGIAYYVPAGDPSGIPGKFDTTNPADPVAINGYPNNPGVSGGYFSADGTKFYSLNTDLNNVSVIDVATNTYTGTSITVGNTPQSIIRGTDDRIYVSNTADGTISVIDTTSDAVVDTIPVSCPTLGALGGYAFPHDDLTYFYIACAIDGVIKKVDTSSGAILSTIDVSASQQNIGAVMISPDNKRLYLSGIFSIGNGDQIAVVDTDSETVSSIINLTDVTLAAIISPDGQYLYASTIGSVFNSATVDVISTTSNSVVETIDTSAVGIPGTILFGRPDIATASVTFTAQDNSSAEASQNLANTGQSRSLVIAIALSMLAGSVVVPLITRRFTTAGKK